MSRADGVARSDRRRAWRRPATACRQAAAAGRRLRVPRRRAAAGRRRHDRARRRRRPECRDVAGRARFDTWTAVPDASGYRVYGRAPGAAPVLDRDGTSFTDTGAAGTSGGAARGRHAWQVKNIFELKNARHVHGRVQHVREQLGRRRSRATPSCSRRAIRTAPAPGASSRTSTFQSQHRAQRRRRRQHLGLRLDRTPAHRRAQSVLIRTTCSTA